MKKYLVTIEFRYISCIENEDTYETKEITIAIADDYEKAAAEGNKVLKFLETKYPLHQYPDGSKAVKRRFNKNDGLFGKPITSINNLAYLKTPFNFFIAITPLKHQAINRALIDVLVTLKNKDK